MNPRGFVLILGAVAGAILSGALIGAPLAYADDTVVPPALPVAEPGLPGQPDGAPTISEFFPFGFGSYTLQDQPYAVGVDGTYDAHESLFTSLLGGFGQEQVFNSAGTAPPDGTTADFFTLLPNPIGGSSLLSNFSVSGPDGTADQFELFGPLINYFTTSAAGSTDAFGTSEFNAYYDSVADSITFSVYNAADGGFMAPIFTIPL